MQNKIMILSAFSLNSLTKFPAEIKVNEISKQETLQIIKDRGFVSYIGHQSTADIISNILQQPVIFNRQTVCISQDSDCIIAQVNLGKRLTEGQILSANEISESSVKFLYLEVKFKS